MLNISDQLSDVLIGSKANKDNVQTVSKDYVESFPKALCPMTHNISAAR